MNLSSDLEHYLSLGFGLVYILTGTKAPQGSGWQHNPFTTPEQAARRWQRGGNIGIHHAASRTAVIDIDHPEWAALALAAVDIDLGELLDAPGPKIRSAKGLKPVYRLRDGLELKRHALAWKEPGVDKALTVFELRAGFTQDVLPPSIHPATGKPYRWHPEAPKNREAIPELPSNIRALWENWSALKPILDKAQPWAAPPHRVPIGAKHQGLASSTRLTSATPSALTTFSSLMAILPKDQEDGYRLIARAA